jgi:D-3-phosphoglycerate dehydrogenase
MARILITDGLSKSAQEGLRKLGHTVDVNTEQPKDKIFEIIEPYEVIIVRSATKVRKEIIDAGKNLKLIIRGGVGVDNIDIPYAESKGIAVRNTPAASSDSVAELALAHMLSVYRFLPDANITMR